MASRLHEILRKDVFSDIETGPRSSAATILTLWHWQAPVFLDEMILTHCRLGNSNESLHKQLSKLNSVTNGWGKCCEIAMRWMSLDHTDDKSTLVQVMAWCREATSHYLNQCWPRSMLPYGITRPQWVNHCIFTNECLGVSIYISIGWPDNGLKL